jgi:hypothetical protein
MKLIENDMIKKLIFYLYLTLFALIIIALIIDPSVIKVIHSRSGQNLPVISEETYSFQDLSLSYILGVLIICNLILMKIEGYKRLRNIIVPLTILATLILVSLLFINPHILILFPSGFPPTQLENILIGGFLIVAISTVFVINSILLIYQEAYFRPYIIPLLTIPLAVLLAGFIHETGHLLFGILSGGVVKAYFPLPTIRDGEFILGLVIIDGIPTALQPLFLLGGEILQWITIALILILSYKIPHLKHNIFLSFLLMICWLDFPLYTINNYFGIPHWFIAGETEGDIIILASLVGIDYWVFILFAIGQLVVGSIIVFKRIKDSLIHLLELKNKGEKNNATTRV